MTGERIPDAILERAKAIVETIDTGFSVYTMAGAEEIIATALLWERERAAKIAEDYAKRAWAAQPSAHEAAVAASKIAEAIRA